MMKISVIIPTYRPQDYLWTCLDSVRRQTFPKENFELILVLNGCDEPYNSQIKEYLSVYFNDFNVNYIQTDKGGVSNARNLALDVAKGDYVTFLDDDDYISPSYLRELFDNASPEIVPLCYPLAFHDGETEQYPYRITKQYVRWAQKGIVPFYKACKFFDGPVYKLIHRDVIGNRRFDPTFSNGEDSLFMFLLSDKFHRVKFTSQSAVYHRRIRQDSATTVKRKRFVIMTNLLRLMKAYSSIYFKDIRGYNFCFYITRMLGALRSMIE